MRWFFLSLLTISISIFGEPISYAGMAIECTQGCGDFESRDFQKMMSLFADTIDRVFRNRFILDESLEGRLINPWGEGDEEEWDYDAWDWKASNGLWPSTSALGALLKDPPTKRFSIGSYQKFLKTASALREDAYFYYCQFPRQEIQIYKSLLPRLQAIDLYEYESIDIFDGGKFELYDHGTSTSTCKNIRELIQKIQYEINRGEDNVAFWYRKYEEKSAHIEKTIEEIDALFKHIFVWCLEHHQIEGITFKAAVESFIAGDYDKALEQIDLLISLSEKHKLGDELLSKLYLLKGQVQSEFCLYSDAVIGLTTAIQKNPDQKDETVA